MLEVIGFDADDTLWDNEAHYLQAKRACADLLPRKTALEQVGRTVDDISIHNAAVYGVGIKSFTLSMVEAAIKLSNGQIQASQIQAIHNLGKRMLAADVVLFDRVSETLAKLSQPFGLMLITKGDLFEQQAKTDRSGLASHFDRVEVVPDKTPSMYRRILEKYTVEPSRFLMVGNPVRSDVLPVLEIGGRAAYIPYEHTWAHERSADDRLPSQGCHQLEHLAQLPALVEMISPEQEGA
jgi:putative hydrolase of the HAD superfamily